MNYNHWLFLLFIENLNHIYLFIIRVHFTNQQFEYFIKQPVMLKWDKSFINLQIMYARNLLTQLAVAA